MFFRSAEKSFTILEIIIVITLIGLITAAGIVPYNNISKNSRDARRKVDIAQIQSALELYRSNNINGSYPNVSDYATLGTTLVEQGYLQQLPQDPKNNEYSYTYTPTIDGTIVRDYTLTAYMESKSQVYQVTPRGIAYVAPTGGPSPTMGSGTQPTATNVPTSGTQPTSSQPTATSAPGGSTNTPVPTSPVATATTGPTNTPYVSPTPTSAVTPTGTGCSGTPAGNGQLCGDYGSPVGRCCQTGYACRPYTGTVSSLQGKTTCQFDNSSVL